MVRAKRSQGHVWATCEKWHLLAARNASTGLDVTFKVHALWGQAYLWRIEFTFDTWKPSI